MPELRKPNIFRRLFLAALRSPLVRPVVQRLGGSMLRHLPGMITCQQFEDFLIDYLEDKLTADQQALFQRHMKVCPMCRTSFQSYLKVIELGQAVCADHEKDLMFDAAPQELIDAIIDAAKLGKSE